MSYRYLTDEERVIFDRIIDEGKQMTLLRNLYLYPLNARYCKVFCHKLQGALVCSAHLG